MDHVWSLVLFYGTVMAVIVGLVWLIEKYETHND